MDGARKNPECGNPDPERQTLYVLTHKGILDVKQRIARLQSIAPEKLVKKKDPKEDAWIALGRGNRRYLLG